MPTILQISAGQGPAECRTFVPLLAEIIRKDAAEKNIICLPLTEYAVRGGETASIRLSVEGELDDFRASWEGTVKWIWQSTIRPHWPRKNWFVKVSFFDFRAEDSGTIRASDLKIETCRASGPGGQHVNRTDSAVRIIHLPTGLDGSAGEERSQTRNRELAMLRLQEKMHLISEQRQASEKSEMRLDHYRLERGGAVRTFKGMPPRECSR
ncbi:MAG: peptide chain release factor H [Lentisphaeria bacterium]|nr:peptide chain release factor H [Lentisphaeria bacterium]